MAKECVRDYNLGIVYNYIHTNGYTSFKLKREKIEQLKTLSLSKDKLFWESVYELHDVYIGSPRSFDYPEHLLANVLVYYGFTLPYKVNRDENNDVKPFVVTRWRDLPQMYMGEPPDDPHQVKEDNDGDILFGVESPRFKQIFGMPFFKDNVPLRDGKRSYFIYPRHLPKKIGDDEFSICSFLLKLKTSGLVTF